MTVEPRSTRGLEGQVALVTGASRGIGRAIAVELGRRGASVVVNFVSGEEAAAETVRRIEQAGGAACAVRADVGQPAEARRLAETAMAERGQVDILVNNAAIQRSALAHKTSDEDWRAVIDVNLSGPFFLARALLPGMLARKRGHIVNVASASAYVAQKGAVGYVASKHGLIGLTKALAAETAGKGVLVNAVAPGLTDTDLVRGLTEEQRAALMGMVPLRRIAAPEEVAAMVAFVVTEAGYSTGNVFHVSGGVVMG